MANVLAGGYQSFAGVPQFVGNWIDPAAEAEERASRERNTSQVMGINQQARSAIQQAFAQQGYLATFDDYPGTVGPGTKPVSNTPKLTRIETSEDRNRALAQQQFELKKNILSQLTGFLSKSDKSGATAPEITKGPEFTPRPVYSPEQMTAQQNLLRDRSMQHAASAGRNAMNRAGAGGMAANAPLLQALRSNLDLAGRIGGEQGALEWSREADVANAQQMLAGQQLAQSQHDAYQQALLGRYQAQIGDRNAILQVLGGLAG